MGAAPDPTRTTSKFRELNSVCDRMVGVIEGVDAEVFVPVAVAAGVRVPVPDGGAFVGDGVSWWDGEIEPVGVKLTRVVDGVPVAVLDAVAVGEVVREGVIDGVGEFEGVIDGVGVVEGRT